MKTLAGVFALMLALAAGFGLASTASGEQIRTDLDGDGKKDLVGAGVQDPGNLLVVSKLSSRGRAFTYLNFPAANATGTFIRAKGDVNGRRGNELFVRTARNSSFDTISVLDIRGGRLVNAGNFWLNRSLSDGHAMGIACGDVKGKPGLRAYWFALRANGRSWDRKMNLYVWRKGRLARVGKTRAGRVEVPPVSQRSLGCPKPTVPPEPPPLLGGAGNRFLSGLGTVEPMSFKARQGTGRYFGFTWKGWSTPRATARGFFMTGPGIPKERMNLTAFGRGRCGGKDAYRKLSLKAAGQGAVTLDIC